MSLSVKSNGDIVGEVKPTVEYDEKYRARRLILDLPPVGEYNILFEVDVQKRADGVVIATEAAGCVNRPFNSITAEMQTFIDPVTGESHTVSVAGLATAIQHAFTRWIIADRG